MTKTARLLALSLVVAFVASNPLNSQQTLPSSLTNGFTPPGLEPGTPAHSYALSGFDNISYFSGKLNFRLPLVKIGGRGEAGYTMMLPIQREWSANAVPYVPPGGTVGCCQPTGYTFSPTPDFGYNIAKYGFFTPGSLYGRVTTSHGTASCQLPTVGQQTVTTAALTRFTFYEPDGTQHELRDAATGGASEPNPNQCNPPQQGYNRGRVFISYDESALRFVADQNVYDTYADGSGSTSLFQVSFPLVVYATGTLYFPDGRSYTIDTLGRVTKIHDRNGNLVTIEYQTDGATPPLPTGIKITDPLGRVIQVTYGSFSSNTAQTIISYPAYNSNIPRQIIVNSAMLGSALRNNYTSQPTVTCEDGSTSPHGIQTFEGLFPDSFADLSQCYNPIVVSSVVLANNQSYQMHYNPYGELARVDLPTGGAFEYDFVSAVPASTGGVMQFNGTAAVGVESTSNPYMAYRRVLTRRVYRDANTLESTTTIPTHAYNPTGDTTVTVTTADSGGNPVSAQTHYFFAQSTTSFNTAYTYGSTGIYYPSWQEGKEFKTEELKTADNSVLRSAVHTFKNGAEAAVDPPLAIDQGFNPHLVQTDTTLDTGQVSRSTFGYDAYSNRIDQSDYDLGSSSPGPLLRQIHHDFVTDPGYVPAAASVSGPYLPALPLHVKTYLGSTTYSEVDYEYDNYTPDGPANHAALSGSSYGTVPQWDSANYPSSVTARGNVTGVSQQVASGGAKVTSALNHDFTTTYDRNVGKPTGFTDVANNVTTTYDYTDSLDRLKQVVRASNVAAVKSQTSYSYNDSTRIVTTTSDQSTYGDNALTSEVEYDGLGRVNHTRHYEGSVCKIAVDMTYDAMGRAATVSNPYQQVTNSDEHCTLETPVSTATVYDSLGRVYSVTAPGGAVTSYGYSGNQTTVTDPAGKARTTAVDALGRLTNVAEDPTGLNYQTAYTFDPIDDLVKVAQGTPATSGTGSVT